MMISRLEYPFCPKSTNKLIPGQFWPIELTNGHFASGRVLQLKPSPGGQDRRLFLAGLMDWCGESPPTSQSLEKAKIIEFGSAHTKMFSFMGFQISGYRALEDDGFEIPLALDQQPSRHSNVVRGFEVIGHSEPDQYSLPTFAVWGMAFIVRLAEHHFLTK